MKLRAGSLRISRLKLSRVSKRVGLSDRRLAYLTERTEDEVRAFRKRKGIKPVYKRVDTCGAEFESFTLVSVFNL